MMRLKLMTDRQLQAELIHAREHMMTATSAHARSKWSQRVEACRLEFASRAYQKIPAHFRAT